MKKHAKLPDKQAGSMVLEALISILIFSIGVLAIVGLQSVSVQQVGDAKYRSEASQLASDLIANMWTTDHTLTSLQANYATTGNGYKQWLSDVNDTLPGVSGVTANQPIVNIVGQSGATSTDTTNTSLVTITLYWQTPADKARGTKHNYKSVTQIAEIK